MIRQWSQGCEAWKYVFSNCQSMVQSFPLRQTKHFIATGTQASLREIKLVAPRILDDVITGPGYSPHRFHREVVANLVVTPQRVFLGFVDDRNARRRKNTGKYF